MKNRWIYVIAVLLIIAIYLVGEVTNRWLDLSLNLFAELLGIALTVFWIDRIIQKREQARWEPSKYLIYSRLVEITWNLFTTFSSETFHTGAGWVIYKFGEIRSVVIDMSKIDLTDESLTAPLYTHLGSISIGEWIEKRNRVREIQGQLDKVITDSSFFLEPELLSLLLKLKQEIHIVVTTLSNLNESAANGYLSEDVYFPIAYSISEFLTATKDVQMWLVSQSTGMLIYEDFRRELLEKYSKS